MFHGFFFRGSAGTPAVPPENKFFCPDGTAETKAMEMIIYEVQATASTGSGGGHDPFRSVGHVPGLCGTGCSGHRTVQPSSGTHGHVRISGGRRGKPLHARTRRELRVPGGAGGNPLQQRMYRYRWRRSDQPRLRLRVSAGRRGQPLHARAWRSLRISGSAAGGPPLRVRLSSVRLHLHKPVHG